MSSLGLALGSFDLLGEYGDCVVDALGDDADFGNPEPIEVAIGSLLQDGSIVVTQGYDNRIQNFRVRFTAPDGASLADAEEAFFAEVGKRNTLTYTPYDGIGAVTVFDVVTSRLDGVTAGVAADLDEIRGIRTWGLRLTAEPFGRSATEVVAEGVDAQAPAGAAVTTVIDDGTSATGWTTSNTSIASVGGEIKVAAPEPWHYTTFVATRTGAAMDTSATPYLYLDYRVSNGLIASAPTLTADGTTLALIAITTAPAYGMKRAYFACPAASVTAVSFALSVTFVTPGVTHLYLDNLTKTNQPPTSGTARQKIRTIEVAGSARTQGTIEVSHATDALGDLMIYTFADASEYAPPLRPCRLSGGTVAADTSLVSGALDVLDTALVFEVPVSALPDGRYVLMARMRSSTAANQGVTWTVQSRLGTTNLGPPQAGVLTHTFPAAGTWENVVIAGSLILPDRKFGAGSPAVVRVTLEAVAAGASDIDLDEAWLFNLTLGALTQVACGTAAPTTGGASNRVWVKPATTDTGIPTVLRGTLADESDAFYPDTMPSWMPHEMKPPWVGVLTVTPNALDASVTGRHYPRWHTHAGS